jgi:predicted  nucleic acid-binding Zn-ribbon protein
MNRKALFELLELQRTDHQLLELKARFAKVDPGRKLEAAVAAARQAFEEADTKLKELRGELEDLELKNKGLDQKIEAENKRLYQGGVYNAKDAEYIEREIKNLMERRNQADSRILELWELIPPAEEEAKRKKEILEKAEQLLAEHRAKYEEVKQKFEQKAKELLALRQARAQKCDPDLLAQYEAIRSKRNGIGLSEVIDGVCTACGTAIPKMQLDRLREEEDVEICRNCGRMLILVSDA